MISFDFGKMKRKKKSIIGFIEENVNYECENYNVSGKHAG